MFRPIFDEKLKARIDAFVLGSHGIVVSDVKKRGRELMANSGQDLLGFLGLIFLLSNTLLKIVIHFQKKSRTWIGSLNFKLNLYPLHVGEKK